MWEVLVEILTQLLKLRITPTYVGSTKELEADDTLEEDHPHVCGKYKGLEIEDKTSEGSPPRMWEVLLFWYFMRASSGITPTYVGST